MNGGSVDLLAARVRRHLAAFERREAAASGELRRAAVAATLVGEAEGPSFVLTLRAAHLPRHASQWALPGGRLEPGESTVEAALRELREEVGLDRGSEHVLGLLDDLVTRSGFVITPVVVWGGRSPALTPDPAEVAKVHRIPLSELDREAVPRLQRIPESDRPILSIPLPYVLTEVFAPTAAVLYQLREVAIHGRSCRVDGYGSPPFAWR
ncbi:MAG: NUDIX hydrolase [Sandaracinaceae bacterium]